MNPRRGLPETLRKSLEVFAERVSELLSHRLVQERPLRAPSYLNTLLHYAAGIPIVDEAWIRDNEEIEKRIDRESLNDILRILRFFELQNEPARIYRIIDSLTKEPIDRMLATEIKKCRRFFSLTDLPKHYTIIFSDGYRLNPAVAFDLYLNGEVFHSSPAKRDRWKELKRSNLEPVLYVMLLTAAVLKAQAVLELYRLLRAYGYVNPVAGDSTLRGPGAPP